MNMIVTRRARSLLARSFPLVHQRREQLVERMEEALAGAPAEAFGQSELAAAMLVELLVTQTRSLVENGVFATLDGVAEEHRAAGLSGRYYSRFGDALVPALRDLLGPTSPREVAGAWSDTFWALIHAVRERVAAESTPVPVAARAGVGLR